jgi:hypothetical protein
LRAFGFLDMGSSGLQNAFGTPGERSVMIDGAGWIVTARNPEN